MVLGRQILGVHADAVAAARRVGARRLLAARAGVAREALALAAPAVADALVAALGVGVARVRELRARRVGHVGVLLRRAVRVDHRAGDDGRARPLSASAEPSRSPLGVSTWAAAKGQVRPEQSASCQFGKQTHSSKAPQEPWPEHACGHSAFAVPGGARLGSSRARAGRRLWGSPRGARVCVSGGAGVPFVRWDGGGCLSRGARGGSPSLAGLGCNAAAHVRALGDGRAGGEREHDELHSASSGALAGSPGAQRGNY